jgi:hypothetical protein
MSPRGLGRRRERQTIWELSVDREQVGWSEEEIDRAERESTDRWAAHRKRMQAREARLTEVVDMIMTAIRNPEEQVSR